MTFHSTLNSATRNGILSENSVQENKHEQILYHLQINECKTSQIACEVRE